MTLKIWAAPTSKDGQSCCLRYFLLCSCNKVLLSLQHFQHCIGRLQLQFTTLQHLLFSAVFEIQHFLKHIRFSVKSLKYIRFSVKLATLSPATAAVTISNSCSAGQLQLSCNLQHSSSAYKWSNQLIKKFMLLIFRRGRSKIVLWWQGLLANLNKMQRRFQDWFGNAPPPPKSVWGSYIFCSVSQSSKICPP